MEKIKPGKYVELGYDLYEVHPNGGQILVHQTNAGDPEKIVFGITPGVIRPLEAAIDGLEPGSGFDLIVKSDEAFGPRDPEQIVSLEKDIFLVDGKFDDEMIKEGSYVPMMTADGFHINGLVLKVEEGKVTLDFNHPLAGKDVRFKGKIITVRDATPEELQPRHECGCGCNHDHCGGDDCGDSCGCGHDHSCGCH